MVFFSATTLGFYPEERKEEYEEASAWPADAVDLTDDELATYWKQCPPQGKLLGSKNGRPAWVGPPPLTGDELKTFLKDAIAARRYDAESAGITVDGVFIDTSRESQGLINGAALSVLLNPDYICNWKTSTGFISLTATQLKVIAMAVRGYVQACFDRESELVSAVEAGTYKEQMLDQGWPTA